MLRALLAVIGNALRNSFLTQQLLVKVCVSILSYKSYTYVFNPLRHQTLDYLRRNSFNFIIKFANFLMS